MEGGSSGNDLPRVSFDSLFQWQQLKSEYSEAMFSQLEEQIKEDGLESERAALRKHTQAMIDKTFKSMQKNLRVNGRNFEDLDNKEEDMEPFDEALDRRIWSMASSRFEWDNNLADVRRTRPSEFTEELQDKMHQLTKADEDQDALYDISGDDVKMAEDDVVVPDFEEVLRNTHALGQELNQAIPTQDERSKRVRVVEREIKALKP